MSLRLLVAEDSKTMQRVVQIAFSPVDASLRVVDNAHEAKRWAQREVYDAYVLDAHLPDEDGYALCQSLAAMGDKPVPTVLLTSLQHPFDPAKATHAGVHAHVDKPFRTQALVQAVYAAMGQPLPPDDDRHEPAEAPPLPAAATDQEPHALPSLPSPSANALADAAEAPYFDEGQSAGKARGANKTLVHAPSDSLRGRSRFASKALFDEAPSAPSEPHAPPPLPSWDLAGLSASRVAPPAMAQPNDASAAAAPPAWPPTTQQHSASAPSAALLEELLRLLKDGPNVAHTPAFSAALTDALERQLAHILWQVVPPIVADEVRRYIAQQAQAPSPPDAGPPAS